MEPVELREYRQLRYRILINGQFRLQDTTEYRTLASAFLGYINGIHDPVTQTIMMLFYQYVCSDVQIADRTHYSVSQVKRIKKSALDDLRKNNETKKPGV